MEEMVTLTSRRTFGSNFIRIAQMWFAGPSGYISVLVIVGIFTFISYNTQPIWLAALGGIAWIAFMLPCLFAMQSWIALRATHSRGMPIFKFDSNGISCDSGKLHTSAPWSGINRLRLTRRTCFVYLTPRCAWFFGRNELSPQDEALLFNFAKASHVRLQGE